MFITALKYVIYENCINLLFNNVTKNFAPSVNLNDSMIGQHIKGVKLLDTPIIAFTGYPIGRTRFIVTDLIVRRHESDEYGAAAVGFYNGFPSCICVDVYVNYMWYTTYTEHEIANIYL